MDSQRFVRQMWNAWSNGNFDEVETAFAPNARWRAVEDGPWNCESRAQILRVMRENRQWRGAPAGTIEEVTDVGGRILVGFRPDSPRLDGWPLENGILRRPDSGGWARHRDEGLREPSRRARLRSRLRSLTEPRGRERASPVEEQ
jgi:hypothetical protein